MTQLTIIGGGITGLTAAYIAAKSGRKVRVLEAKNEFGGLLNTFPIGGNRLEYFYHHFFTHDAELMWLMTELDLEKEIIWEKTSMGIFRNGQVYDFNSPLDLLKFQPLSFLQKMKFGFSNIYLSQWADWTQNEHISALDWFFEYAGKQVTESIWKPLLEIKFGPYFNQVPLAWMIGRLRQRVNSRKSGAEQLGYVNGSLSVLLERLKEGLERMNVELIANARVEKLIIDKEKLVGIETPNEIYYDGDFLFTIPTIFLSKLLKSNLPNFAEKLSKIEYFGAVCVILEMTQPLSEIYWLNIADPGFPFGGIIEQTNLISPQNYNGKHIAYLSRYFAQSESISKMKNVEIGKQMMGYLNEIYPNFDQKNIEKTHVFRTNTAATVCDLNFSNKVPNCETPIQNLYISSMAHVYPDERSMNNSIRIAAEACKVMGIDADFVPYNSSLSGKIGFSKKSD